MPPASSQRTDVDPPDPVNDLGRRRALGGMAVSGGESESLPGDIAALHATTSRRASAPLRVATTLLRRTLAAGHRKPEAVAGTVAICMLRDCADIVPFLCGHYLRLGFERIVFVDDQSSDGTLGFLDALSRREPRLRAMSVGETTRMQAEVMTEVANEAIAAGRRTIFPFDADEFWAIDRARLAAIAADQTPRAIAGHWINFMQRRSTVAHQRGSLFGARHRAVATDAVCCGIASFHEAFANFTTRKLAVVSGEPIRYGPGQHDLVSGPIAIDPVELELFHLPFRNKSELLKRAVDYEPRRAPFRASADEGWQANFHAEAYRTGRVDEVWAANSVDRRGVADVYGQPRAAIPDTRLLWLLAAASFHMFRRYGLVVG